MAKNPGLDDLVGSLYDAALAPELWPDVLLEFQQRLSAGCGHFFIWNKEHNAAEFSVTNEHMRAAGEAYVQHYGVVDPRRPIMIRNSIGGWMLCHEHFDQNFVRRSEFYSDFLAPLDLRYVAGSRVFDTGKASAVMAFLRSKREGPFVGDSMKALQRVTPHFQRARKSSCRWQWHAGLVHRSPKHWTSCRSVL